MPNMSTKPETDSIPFGWYLLVCLAEYIRNEAPVANSLIYLDPGVETCGSRQVG